LCTTTFDDAQVTADLFEQAARDFLYGLDPDEFPQIKSSISTLSLTDPLAI
jgi:hypothetical protein